MSKTIKFEQLDLNKTPIGGHYLLSLDGEYLDRKNEIWRNSGQLKSKRAKINVILMGPACKPSLRQSILKRATQERYSVGFQVNATGTVQVDGTPVHYAVIKPDIALAREIASGNNPPNISSRRPSGFMALIAILIFILLIAGFLVGGEYLSQTPTLTTTPSPTLTFTPTATITPTPTSTSTSTATATVTPLPTLTPSQLTAIFADDFSDSQKTENQWLQLSGEWDSIQGIYTCQNDDNACISLESQEIKSDFVVSVDIRGITGTDKSVHLGYVENQKDLVVLFRSDPINQIIVAKHIEGQPDVVVTQTSFDLKNNVWYRVNILAVQNSLKIRLNNEQILDLTVDTPADLYGRVGLGIPLISDNKSVASFDNFIITTPNEPLVTITPTP